MKRTTLAALCLIATSAVAGPGFFRPTAAPDPAASNGPAEAPPRAWDCQIIVRSNVQNSWEVTVELYGDERCDKSRVAVAREALRQVRCASEGYCPPPARPRWPDTPKP